MPDDAATARTAAARVIDDIEWSAVARRTADCWWRRHPANAVGQLARPMLTRYAREQPGKLIAVAVATGAVAVLIKPWRLLPATVLVAALFKTSDIADMVTTLMNKERNPTKGK